MIFSRSAKNLQKILNKLESFCENADLSVNFDKTKIMIFNNCCKLKSLYLNNDIRKDANQGNKMRTYRLLKTIDNYNCEDYLTLFTVPYFSVSLVS